MPYDDGRNSARARSARIRASHDHEGTQLEEMRRRTRELGQPEPRLLARLAAAIGRVRRSDAGSGQVVAAEAEIASGGTQVQET
jgi:serine/threonine protein phosphatase PrpC